MRAVGVAAREESDLKAGRVILDPGILRRVQLHHVDPRDSHVDLVLECVVDVELDAVDLLHVIGEALDEHDARLCDRRVRQIDTADETRRL